MNVALILIPGVLVFIAVYFWFLQMKSKWQLNKLRRNYDAGKDPSRRGKPADLAGTASSDHNGKSDDTEPIAPAESVVRTAEPVVEPVKPKRPFPLWGRRKNPVVENGTAEQPTVTNEPTAETETDKA